MPAPPGKDRKHGYAGRALVLARLEWPRETVVIPAVAVWVSDDRICIEWEPHGRAGATRMTWLMKADVRTRMTLPR